MENGGLIMKTETDCQVSVMITFCNQKQFISDCLSSVLSQKTDFSFEILCGDDCSVDGTYEELLKWQQQYPDFIRVFQTDKSSLSSSEPIIRASNNRYNLLCHAKGKYVCFLDGDDYYSDDRKLQKQFDVLEKHPKVSACFHPILLKWDNDHSDVTWSWYSDKRIIMSNKLYWGCLWAHAESFLFRNNNPNLISWINKDFFDDNLITAYFIREGRILYIPDTMIVYRQSNDSSWNKRNEFEKTYINLLVYQESKRVLPGLKSQCFTKCYDDIRFLYDKRNKDWDIRTIPQIPLNESIYIDTLKYMNSGYLYKIKYVIKWIFPIYFGKVLKVLRNRLKTHIWKNI